MENRLKERLTGAAILVALIVLIVPELFRGPQPSAPATHPADAVPAAAARSPALPSFAIDLSGKSAAVATAPVALEPSAAPTPSATVAVSPPTATHSSGAPRPSSRPPSNTNAVRAPGGARATSWSVQLGLFAKQNNAERLAHTAEAKGFMARVVRAGAKGLYRVAIANVADRDAAEQLSRRLHAAGLPGAIVGPR